MKKPSRVAITTGDWDGIGLEVTAKALARIRPQKGTQFYVWRSPRRSVRDLRSIDRYFKRITVTDWAAAMNSPADYHNILIDIESPLPPGRWVEQMANCGLSGSIDALVTAPLSKTEIARSGLKDKGHTDILKRVCHTPDVFMCFLGKEFNVVLLSDHVSLKTAYNSIKKERIVTCATLIQDLKQYLPKRQQALPIGLVGVNPHAGELGIIDSKEQDHFIPAIQDLTKSKVPIVGPLVGDVCFKKEQWRKYSFYMASYHDQGLIPFKLIHGQNRGIQLSLGLPFLRLSVDHGTAKDIFGKDRADPSSMQRAILTTIKQLNKQRISW